MKRKIMLAAMAFGICAGAFAQKPGTEVPFSVETQLGIDGSPINNPNLRARYFLSESMAIRGNIDINRYSNSQVVDEPYTTNFGLYNNDNVSYGLGAGIELHMGGTDRLSPYFGGNFDFNRYIWNTEWVDATSTSNYDRGYYRIDQGSTNTYTISALAGVDYYFAENFYVGVETGYYWSISILGDRNTQDNTQGNIVDVQDGGTVTHNVYPSAISGIRLGWRFALPSFGGGSSDSE